MSENRLEGRSKRHGILATKGQWRLRPVTLGEHLLTCDTHHKFVCTAVALKRWLSRQSHACDELPA